MLNTPKKNDGWIKIDKETVSQQKKGHHFDLYFTTDILIYGSVNTSNIEEINTACLYIHK